MPNATELIKKDHRTVEQMFEQFESSPSHEMALEICSELAEHTEMEEQIVYPELKKVDEALFEDAQQEHDEVDQLIQQVRQCDAGDLGRIQQLMTEIKQNVEHHVEDEETEDLPAMEQACGAETMERLGERMAQWKLAKGGGDGKVDLTKEELYEMAKDADIEGRSKMNKDELAEELSKK